MARTTPPTPDPGRAASEDADALLRVLRDVGVTDEAAREAVERDDPELAVLESTLFPGRAARTVSAREVEARGGPSAAEMGDLMQAMGFPRPDPEEPTLTPEEADVFVELTSLRETWSHELTVGLARVYGRLLARIARTGVQFFRLHAEPRVRATSGRRDEQLVAMREAFERLVSLPDPLLAGIHRRWLEYELAQTAVDRAQADPRAPLSGTMDVTLLFCDLKDFTAYANSAGDAAAVEAIDGFARIVDAERGEEGRVVKALGDGHMLSYPDTASAVAAGARVIEAMRARGPLGVHASVHRGIAIAREGDYFGEAVNLAARLLVVAGRDELVASAGVASGAGNEFEWESLGVRSVRGVAEPIEVFSLLQP